ncbi:MAG: peptidoglycan editing factor PgeF [Candidatus Moraniibacteriota bacterium]|nr:MAG: peptidoglycan editing factor PgeF [Candidatus Moranbacteria bacterium]
MTLRVKKFLSLRGDGNMAYYAGKGREKAQENRYRFFENLGISLERSVFLKQIHGTKSTLVRKEDIGRGSKSHENALLDTDAIITDIFDVALVVQIADCVPILFFEDNFGFIGAIHSGWRGTLQNITGKTIENAVKTYGLNRDVIKVWIGPSVRGCCFEVDERIVYPVRERGFLGLSENESHWDIAKACKGQLENIGILSKHIEMTKECTVCTGEKFFSYKREGETAGRILAGIYMTKE